MRAKVYLQNIKNCLITLFFLEFNLYTFCIDLNTDLRKDNEFNDTRLLRDTNDAKKVACIQNQPFCQALISDPFKPWAI